MTKAILITGGAGFIGSHLAEYLIENGNCVIVLDNLSTGSKTNISKLSGNKMFTFIKGDVLNQKLVDSLVKKTEVVYHLAAILGVSQIVNDPLKTIKTNIESTEVVAKAALKYNSKIIFTSSSEVYGKSDKIPLAENGDLVFGNTELTRWNYGISKTIDEHIIYGYSNLGLKFSIARLFNSYGPRCINSKYLHVIPKFITLALKNKSIPVLDDGKAIRTFCYVTDTVDGIVSAGNKLENEVVNIGSNKATKIIDLARLIIKLTKSRSKIISTPGTKMYGKGFDDIPTRIPDTSKATKKLGFNPKIDLNEGVQKTIDWIRSFGKIY